MAYWLFKSEPETWSWEQQKKKAAQGEPWSGVRNHQAANNMKAMKKGDRGFFYHSGGERRRPLRTCRGEGSDGFADAGHAFRREGRCGTERDGACKEFPPVGAAGHERRMEEHLRHGRR